MNKHYTEKQKTIVFAQIKQAVCVAFCQAAENKQKHVIKNAEDQCTFMLCVRSCGYLVISASKSTSPEHLNLLNLLSVKSLITTSLILSISKQFAVLQRCHLKPSQTLLNYLPLLNHANYLTPP